MATPFSKSDFIQLNTVSDEEIYNHEGADTMVSFSGNIEQINRADLEHLVNGKYLLDLNDGEYIQVIRLAPDAIKWLKDM
ncbi:MAG TPA: hypothetical protein K8V88_11820 [Companilactobacillus farciminis]|uniref:Uncharacterized protein n=1 Tax=Companilactobacillus farciminis TaxID=1612 RepID=A0A921HUF8_9LACO|nr:hypothetical protein [Companilactobacillus farciminis]